MFNPGRPQSPLVRCKQCKGRGICASVPERYLVSHRISPSCNTLSVERMNRIAKLGLDTSYKISKALVLLVY